MYSSRDSFWNSQNDPVKKEMRDSKQIKGQKKGRLANISKAKEMVTVAFYWFGIKLEMELWQL